MRKSFKHQVFIRSATNDDIRARISEAASYKFGVTAVAGAAATIEVVEITWPIAAIAMAYIAGQTAVDTWGD